jgi:hypothetical protein
MAFNFLPQQIFQNIPVYSGKTSCEKWIDKFNAVCTHFQLNSMWKLMNMERFLSGTANDWWSFSKNPIMINLNEENSEERLQLFYNNLRIDFPEEDDRKIAESENVKLHFRVQFDNPKDYIFKKLSIFYRMDENMTDGKKLEYLYQGLNSELRWLIKRQLGSQGTIQEFVAELKCFSEEMKWNVNTSNKCTPALNNHGDLDENTPNHNFMNLQDSYYEHNYSSANESYNNYNDYNSEN